MASIIKSDNWEADGRWIIRAIGSDGEDIEQECSTHAEAQAIANVETVNQMKYFGDFQVIDGLNQHPTGLNFVDWLKSKK